MRLERHLIFAPTPRLSFRTGIWSRFEKLKVVFMFLVLLFQRNKICTRVYPSYETLLLCMIYMVEDAGISYLVSMLKFQNSKSLF